MDSSPFPPSRSTSLPKQAFANAENASASSPREVILPAELAEDHRGLSRTKSQPQFDRSNNRDNATGPSVVRSHSLAKIQTQNQLQASFGQAITCEEPAPPTRQRTQAYASSHHRQSSLSTPVHHLPQHNQHARTSVRTSRVALPAETRTRQSSDNTMTGRSIRSVGSSFDIDLYTQMQLQEDNDSLEEEMRRSYSNPLAVDGAMDFPSPAKPPSIAHYPSSLERKVVKPYNHIPELTFRQPTFELTSDLGLPALRPHTGEGRKFSDYTHPRPAPEPPLAASHRDVKASRYADAAGRPLSPSKSRAKQNASRMPLQALPLQNMEDEDDVLLPYLSEEHAERILREDASVLTGYGTAAR